jgi:DNA-binding NtrC family response regulator
MRSLPSGRDYGQLLDAMNVMLTELSSDGGEQEALSASFAASARGFGAEKALLLSVEQTDPLRLRAICTTGKLSPGQVRACERGESVPGVSPSVIRSVLASRRPELIEDARLRSEPSRTPSLAAGGYGVLCAPIMDAWRATALAVLYFQQGGLTDPYGAADLAWLAGYAGAVGRVFAFAFQQRHRSGEPRRARDAGEGAPEILGESAHIQALRRMLHETYIPAIEAKNPEPILILGDRGTGKDLVARYLHAYSARGRHPMVVVNCAEITDELAASRFFGHKKGAFTGAVGDESGFFRAANGGALFLDEVAELSPRTQAHLLRVLENHTVVPVGETRELPVDVAVILATNRDLDAAIRDGVLRADFHDRFRSLTLRLLPLSERPWDVPTLLEHFRLSHERKHHKRTLGFSREALRALVAYAWPGNVRELARACSLFVIYAAPGARIDRALIERATPEVLHGTPNPKAGPLLWDDVPLRDAMRSFERELIMARLERHDGNVEAARESLGLTRTTFHRYRRSLGIAARSDASED